MRKSARKSVALMLLAGMVWGCTYVRIAPSGSRSSSQFSTVGVASVAYGTGCKSVFLKKTDEKYQREDPDKSLTRDNEAVLMNCDKVVYLKSSGFTGFDTIDAAISAFISYVTFGAVIL